MAERKLHSGEGRRRVEVFSQLTSTNDKEKNFQISETLIHRAKDRHTAEMVFLPENFDYLGQSIEETLSLAYTENDAYRQLAIALWLLLGGFHEKDPGENAKSRKTHLILNDQGQTVGKYFKLHLFDIDIKNKVRVKESDFTIYTNAVVPLVQSLLGKVGLSWCYELRFPEQAQLLRKVGAEIVTYPSAFTLMTGMTHWEPLPTSSDYRNAMLPCDSSDGKAQRKTLFVRLFHYRRSMWKSNRSQVSAAEASAFVRL